MNKRHVHRTAINPSDRLTPNSVIAGEKRYRRVTHPMEDRYYNVPLEMDKGHRVLVPLRMPGAIHRDQRPRLGWSIRRAIEGWFIRVWMLLRRGRQ